MKSFVRLGVAACGGLMLAGCGGRQLMPLNQPQAIPAPVATTFTAAEPDAKVAVGYVLSPLDVIRIDVFGEPELSLANLPINTDGTVVMPLIGSVTAQGLTAAQFATLLSRRLDPYLRNPRVAVNVTEFVSQKVTISGSVNKPGQYQAPGRISLMQAVAVGGGLNSDAAADEVIVFREQNGQSFAARFDLGAIQAGQASDPQLLSGDTVVVGVSNARRIFRDILGVLPLAAGVFIALIPRL